MTSLVEQRFNELLFDDDESMDDKEVAIRALLDKYLSWLAGDLKWKLEYGVAIPGLVASRESFHFDEETRRQMIRNQLGGVSNRFVARCFAAIDECTAPEVRPVVESEVRDGIIFVKNRREMLDFLKLRDKVCFEVGVFRGTFAREILRRNPSALVLIDPWKHQSSEVFDDETANLNQDDFDLIYQEVASSLGNDCRVVIQRDFSTDVASRTGPSEIDFIYIDANHGYDAVMADLNMWWPHIRNGGWICGHDWCWLYPDVERAVVDFQVSSGKSSPDLLTESIIKSWGIKKNE